MISEELYCEILRICLENIVDIVICIIYKKILPIVLHEKRNVGVDMSEAAARQKRLKNNE